MSRPLFSRVNRLLGFFARSICCVVLALWLIPFVPAQDDKPDVGRLLPGNGVADPAAKMGFFPNTTGGIDAVDLTTGKAPATLNQTWTCGTPR